MASPIVRKILALDLEEKILNGASLLAFVCVFFPWVGGEWLGGKAVTYSGLGFFTSFIGLAILLIHAYIVLMTAIPVLGGPQVVSRRNRNALRLFAALLATILTIAVWSVLTKFTFEFSRLEIHFGLYGTMVGGLVSTLYAFLLMQGERRADTDRLFSHDKEPDDRDVPPPPQQPESHRIY